MHIQNRIFFDLWYQEDEVSEWYEEYLRAQELFVELSNLHSGIRCNNLLHQPCGTCEKITGSSWEMERLLLIIDQYEVTVTDGQRDLEIPSATNPVDAGDSILSQILVSPDSARRSYDVVARKPGCPEGTWEVCGHWDGDQGFRQS